MIIDHDMFLIKELQIDRDSDITGVMQCKGGYITYFHPGFMIINNTLKDKETVSFKGEKIDGIDCDSGGNWYHYIKAHPDLKIKGLPMVNICAEHENLHLLPEEARIDYNENDPLQIIGYDNSVLHYRNGSNWAQSSSKAMERKKEQLRMV